MSRDLWSVPVKGNKSYIFYSARQAKTFLKHLKDIGAKGKGPYLVECYASPREAFTDLFDVVMAASPKESQ